MKRVFRGLKGMSSIVSRQNANLKMIEGVKRRQTIVTVVGFLFGEIVTCAFMMIGSPALGLLLQHKSNECKQRNSVGSHRMSAFGIPLCLAMHIMLWLMIYSHVVRERREEYLTMKKEMESRQALQISSLVST